MARLLRTAVAACASHHERRQIIHGLAAADIELLCMCGDGASALQALADHRADLLVTGAHLPVMDGISLARRVLSRRNLPVRPAVLIVHPHEYRLPMWDNLVSMGAVFLDGNASAEAFAQTINYLQAQEFHWEKQQQQRVEHILDALGFPDHPGRSCLQTAVLYCAGDERLRHKLSTQLFPMVGAACGMHADQVERAIRHGIDLAWRSNKIENQYRIFADTVDAGRGQPTCSEMISRLADILRLEG